jgi:uncharacterized protein (TIGR02466 family)
MNVYGLFPVGVGISKLERNFSDEELSFIKKNEINRRPNEGNYSSIDYEVLERNEMVHLKSFIMNEVKKYFDNILCPAGNIEPYINLSWLNYTYKDGYHHKHAHANSIISGVFYIQTTNDDMIWFHKEKYSAIEFSLKEFNTFNAAEWWLPADQNTLILFPSDLLHSVKPISTNETRISLSFNVFVKGELGEKAKLNWLGIK